MKYIFYALSVILSLYFANSAFSQKFIIITDVDDTIKITKVMVSNKDFIENGIKTKMFFNMNTLFQKFMENNDSLNSTPSRNILYVTGAPGILGYPALHFLQANHFPMATESNFIGKQTPSIDKNYIINKIREIKNSSSANENLPQEAMFPFATSSKFINKKINESIYNGKVSSIKPIIENNPDAYFILLGDNGQLDPDVYKQMQLLYPNRVYTFIHYAYEGPSDNKIVNYSKNIVRKRYEIYQNQIPFFTVSDLALQFYKLGVINRNDLLEILNTSILAIDPIYYSNSDKHIFLNNQKLIYDSWMTGCLGFMNSEWNRLVSNAVINDAELSEKFFYFNQLITNNSGCNPYK
ncbi:DUF2183 domain-containing protein [Silvanigrella paludirubra]|uniref:DUF2183 domain-containing protein n=1 Tax=Silvanigrella paludirubra TaxID=2499159 RepID=A0A6N6VXP0_9BACT|nr:phosphatase domain-containing protein [Silvanigrella paludirubra]KAB8040809.1 DUF2183 domain-containing protein [Silvanigrella paludirubra]